MQVTIDATGLLLPSAGVKNYLHHWIRALMSVAPSGTIKLFPTGHRNELNHAAGQADVTDRLALALVNFLNIRNNPATRFWPWRTSVFHCSQHIANPPVRRGLRLTSTIYDFTCWRVPETHEPKNVAATKRYAERVLLRSDACIAISESARQDALELLGMAAGKIRTVYPGVPDAFFDPPAAERVRKTYGLVKPYCLYVGTIEPRKGVGTILDAWDGLPSSITAHCDLVLAGMYGWCSDAVYSRIQAGRQNVRYLGYVPEADLPALTAGALMLIFPSLYEGFGFPVAQGMAAGTPVITSYGSSLEEIAGGACMLVNPRDTEELRNAICTMAESSSLRQLLREKGKIRAARFRWENCARESLEFFADVALLS